MVFLGFGLQILRQFPNRVAFTNNKRKDYFNFYQELMENEV